jgi:hypothetical protein
LHLWYCKVNRIRNIIGRVVVQDCDVYEVVVWS